MTRTPFAAALLGATLLLPVVLAPGQAAANIVCADRDALVEYLADRFAETPAGSGISSGGAVLELFVSEAGAWAILATAPGGPTCAVVTGRDWAPLPKPPGKRT